VFEGSGVYLLAAFVLTALILGGYLWSLTTRARDAERDAARRQERR
jgi:hypothetical protein